MTDHELAQAIARWSRDCRTLLGVSQETVAKASGVSQAAVSRLEHGSAATMGIRVYARVARYYAARAARLGMTLTPLRLDDPSTAPAVTGLDATHATRSSCAPSRPARRRSGSRSGGWSSRWWRICRATTRRPCRRRWERRRQ